MSVFLAELSARFPDDYLLVVYDGAPCHSPGVLAIPEHVEVVTLPAKSPQLNPQENVWDDMREKFFQNIVFDSMKAVETRLIEACTFYETHPEIIHSITGWKWIINHL